MENKENKTRIAQDIIVDKIKELSPEGLKGYRVLVYHESDTLEDILKLNSDAFKFEF